MSYWIMDWSVCGSMFKMELLSVTSHKINSPFLTFIHSCPAAWSRWQSHKHIFPQMQTSSECGPLICDHGQWQQWGPDYQSTQGTLKPDALFSVIDISTLDFSDIWRWAKKSVNAAFKYYPKSPFPNISNTLLKRMMSVNPIMVLLTC